jgi:hypothetical protein
MLSRSFLVALLCVTACSSAGADGSPGYETGPCIEGECFDGLACLSDLCVGSGDDDDDDGGPGGLDVTGSSDSATTSPGMTSDPGESTASDPSSPTSPTSLTTNATNDDTGVASAESADDGTTTGTNTGGDPCGDGAVQPGEQCDGNDLQGFDCASLGLGGGDLQCDPITCSFDTSMCVPTTSGTSG